MKKCVLILARGGSKSVPRKNVVDLNGRPLITYAIRAGKESGIDDVWVSTEDSEIEEVSKKEGALIHERAEYLAQDLSTDLECFRDFFEKHKGYDYAIQLRATSPQITSEIIQDAVDKFEKDYKDVDALRSVVSLDKSPFKSWFIEDNVLIPVIPNNSLHSSPRQILRPAYFQNACIDIVKRETVLKKNSMVGGRCLSYVMEDVYNIDIDTLYDLHKARNNFEEK